ncbi:MAG: NAD(P)/FAD-dependent oxidoreductase [Desulfotomaculaceae bacterium]
MLKMYDVIIVGAGPAGIFSAYELVKNRKDIKILIIDKGKDIDDRHCPSKDKGVKCTSCKPCSIMCGWGGAGAFSDGKLTLSTEVGGSLGRYLGDEALMQHVDYVDKIYLEFGAPEELAGTAAEDEIEAIRKNSVRAGLKLVPAPIRHLGTGRCKEVLRHIRDFLLAHGVWIETRCQVNNVLVEDGKVTGVDTGKGEVKARYVVVAPGREGSEWLVQQAGKLGLHTGVNPVDLGVRVEVPAPVMEHLTRVVYESKFIYYSKTFDDKARTFCMNPYGEVVQENLDGLVTVNGHSHAYRKTNNTNFAVLVSKTFTEPFKDPISYGRYIASLANLLGDGIIVQRLGDLLSGRRTNPDRLAKGFVVPTLKEATPGDLSLALPYRYLVTIVEMLKVLDKVAPGIYSRHTLLYGVEVKFYSVRLSLTGGLETQVQNLFAAGDGAGITRGLAQASAAGVVAAREILSRI